jgi:hypothetical protein
VRRSSDATHRRSDRFQPGESAIGLGAHGDTVVLFARGAKGLAGAAAQMERAGGADHVMPADVADRATAKRCCTATSSARLCLVVRGSPREDRIDRGAVRLHHGLGSPLARQVHGRAADGKDHINLEVQISRAARDQQ